MGASRASHPFSDAGTGTFPYPHLRESSLGAPRRVPLRGRVLPGQALSSNYGARGQAAAAPGAPAERLPSCSFSKPKPGVVVASSWKTSPDPSGLEPAVTRLCPLPLRQAWAWLSSSLPTVGTGRELHVSALRSVPPSLRGGHGAGVRAPGRGRRLGQGVPGGALHFRPWGCPRPPPPRVWGEQNPEASDAPLSAR